MPYIKKEQRKYLDKHIDKLTEAIIGKLINNDRLAGEINYTLFRMIGTMTGQVSDNVGAEKSYGRFNAILGALECCKQEVYRRMISPYEDQKIEENGDV